MEFLWEIVLDALLDSVKMIPFLFAAYFLIEYIEQRHSDSIERALAGGGRFGFAVASLLGLVPQCGFSAMAANLYASRVVSLGTLLAVFVATSDEAIPLLLASPQHWRAMLMILGIKLVVALLVGFALDVVLRSKLPAVLRGGYAGSAQEVDCHEHDTRTGIFVSALRHTLHIFAFILLFNLLLGAVVGFVGEDRLAALLAASGFWQPFLAALVGLIPNCVSSILLTQLFLAGQLSLGGVVAGLCTGAGVGLAVLLRTNRSWKQNVCIIALLYAIGVVAGLVCGLF